jgi:ArsR family transcriptional regulator, arsenate/arsenite/antimonite-responsive transcriptional repressor
MTIDTGTLHLNSMIVNIRSMSVTSEPAAPPGAAAAAVCDVGCAPAGMSQVDAEKTAVVLRALADPVRLRLYTRIAAASGDEVCVCDIQDVGVSQPTVSHHLRKLREAGLIDCERRGTWVYYRTVSGALDPVGQLLK